MAMRAASNLRFLRLCLLFGLVSVLILFAGRLVLWFGFTDALVREQFAADLPRLLWKGLLFDIKATAIAVAIPVLLGFLAASHTRLTAFWHRCLPFVLSIFTCIIAAATAANIYFFKVYERQFDVFVFGLWEEDTRAVLATIWADYPVITASVMLLGLACILWKMYHQCLNTQQNNTVSTRRVWAYAILIVLALTLGIRGSLGKFPLRQDDSQISVSPELNKLVPNALIALDWARKEFANSAVFTPASDSEGKVILQQILGQSVQDNNLKQLLAKTPTNTAAEQRAPNVVFGVMESLSSHLLLLDNPERDFLGSLKPHFEQDWLFRRFVSEGDGTSDSLHRLLVRSPLLNLSQSSAKQKNFISNMFAPYRAAGYDIVFITAGNGGWRNFDQFLRHLGVDEVADENFLKQRYPEAANSAATWGVADEFMFRYAAERLIAAEQAQKPVFIMLLSVTNHPPYRLPPPHTARHFALTAAEAERLSGLGNAQTLQEILNTFRYANDELGKFISQVKQSAPHTIIAATGDHNMRAIGYAKPYEQALGHAVPFYLFVPESYRANAVYMPNRAGSHKDILPTLYELSLSQQPYYRTGCNLTAQDIDGNPWCGYGFNAQVIIMDDGFYRLGENAFYPWQAANTYPVAQSEAQAIRQPEIAQRANAYPAFLPWQLNKMIMGSRP